VSEELFDRANPVIAHNGFRFFNRENQVIENGQRETYVCIDGDERYETTAVGAMNEEFIPAIDSARNTCSVSVQSGISSDSHAHRDIFGSSYNGSELAHLMPHGQECATYWSPIVSLIFKKISKFIPYNNYEHNHQTSNESRDNVCKIVSIIVSYSESNAISYIESNIESNSVFNPNCYTESNVFGNVMYNIETSTDILMNYMYEQRCIHGFKLQEGLKQDNVGIKHFPTNQIRLQQYQAYFDEKPCVLIIPIMNVEQMRDWNGEAYDAIVLAGEWKGYTASCVYNAIGATFGMVDNDTFKINEALFASESTVDVALALLRCMCWFFCDALNGAMRKIATLGKINGKSQRKGDAVLASLSKLRNERNSKLYLPLSVCMDKGLASGQQEGETEVSLDSIQEEETLALDSDQEKGKDGNKTGKKPSIGKVRMISFAPSTDFGNNPAPDPLLLTTKAVYIWCKRQEYDFVPGSCHCSDDSSCSCDDDSTCSEQVDVFRNIWALISNSCSEQVDVFRNIWALISNYSNGPWTGRIINPILPLVSYDDEESFTDTDDDY
jgi:hypothetical protein